MKFPIQFKIVVVFSIIIFVGLSAMLFVSYRVTEQNMYQIIDEDMFNTKTNLDIYINQYFLVHKKRMSKESLVSEKNRLTQELTAGIGGPVTIFYMNGDKNQAESTLRSQIAYTINRVDHKVIVSLSFPILQKQSTIGFLEYQKDYSQLYQRNARFQSIIKMFASVIFSFIFIASIFISRKITKPIRELTERSNQVTLGNFNIDISISSRDEIGELARRFQIMIKHIKNQIEIIKQERDEVKQAQAQSKVFFDNVTHELKTPLTTILGYAQIVKDNGFTDAFFFEKGLNYIIHESQRLNRTVVEILELSQSATLSTTYHFEKVDLSEIAKEACEDMKIKARKYNIDIHFELQEGLFTLGDRDKMKEVFLNLLDNSIKYGYVNSMIYVESWKEGDTAVVKIKDEGEGIPAEQLNYVFEPFYRAKRNAPKEKGSAGLGLTIVKNIVDDHHGAIKLQSILNEGTEIKISLPGDGK
ncbi:sensor histidine kinase [Paenibacillus donghaensis]|uniref:histidine kinase n=1 Tax=Paenibacillus donghaensis TaxID=414771 RepID=A0A2Z2KCS1_9BACL|nr:HAMP domain-containing sensor histidine kinase [Paenibacillus donghaensis]ASA20753.1 two-component sensor histidine kinase [Paenibacillus donghaensis]